MHLSAASVVEEIPQAPTMLKVELDKVKGENRLLREEIRLLKEENQLLKDQRDFLKEKEMAQSSGVTRSKGMRLRLTHITILAQELHRNY